MKKAILLFVFINSFAAISFAQPWMKELGNKPNPNFYDMQKAFYKYWDQKEREENKWYRKLARAITHGEIENERPGYEQFKRWEWFMQPRVSSTGEIPDPMILWKESKKLKEYTSSQQTAAWTLAGPINIPSGGGGAGRLCCIRVNPQNNNIIWVGAPAGGLWKSINGGSTWTSNNSLPTVIGVSDIVINPLNNNTMYIGTGDADDWGKGVGVLKSIDGGVTWNTTALDSGVVTRLLINPSNPNILIASVKGQGIGVYKTTDGGLTWVSNSTFQTIYSNFAVTDMKLNPANPNVVYVATALGTFYRSIDGGNNYSLISSGLPASGVAGNIKLAVTAANPARVYAVMDDNSAQGFYGVYSSADAGVTWSQKATSPNILGWAADGSDSGGQGGYDLAIAISPTNENELYVGGVDIWKSVDGASSFSCNAHWYGANGLPYVHADVHTFEMLSNNTLYAGCDGGIFKTSDLGTTWQDLSNGLSIMQVYRLSSSQTNVNKISCGGQDNGSNLKNGLSWSYIDGGDGGSTLIDYSNENIIYVTGNGYISKTTDNGATFSYVLNCNNYIPAFIMHPQNPQTLYLGLQDVCRSTNGGSTWDTISHNLSSNDNILALAVAPTDGNTLYAAIYQHLFKTNNQGNTWVEITSGLPAFDGTSSIAVSQTDPQTLWVVLWGFSQINGGTIYKSSDGGSTWISISGGLPANVYASSIVAQKGINNVLYLGSDLGVFYHDDIQGSWTPFNTGLPNVPIDELDIQFAANKLRVATYGRGIWETPIAPPMTTGICEAGADLQEMKIYPVISTGIFNVELLNANPINTTIEIYSANGQLIKKIECNFSGNKIETIDISDKSLGIYFVKMKDGLKEYSKKIVLVR